MSKEGLSEEVTCELRDVKGAFHKDLRQEWSQPKEVTAETLKWKTVGVFKCQKPGQCGRSAHPR